MTKTTEERLATLETQTKNMEAAQQRIFNKLSDIQKNVQEVHDVTSKRGAFISGVVAAVGVLWAALLGIALFIFNIKGNG